MGWLGYRMKNVKDINEKINCIAFCKMHVYDTEPWIKVTSTRFETFSIGSYNRYDTKIMAGICIEIMNLYLLTFRQDENKVEV